jgi:hypothetical protein
MSDPKVGAKKATAPPPDPMVAAKKTATALGSSGSSGGGPTVAQADTEKVPSAKPEAAKATVMVMEVTTAVAKKVVEAAAAKEVATSAVAMEATEVVVAKEAAVAALAKEATVAAVAKKVTAVMGPDRSSGDGSGVAQTDVRKGPNMTLDPKGQLREPRW